VPRIFDELTSERVLTMELLEGETLKDFFHRLAEHTPEQKYQAARLLILSIWGPFLRTGAIHGDPHPGNFLVLPDGRMGVLDFGAVRKLSDAWLDVNRRLYRALVDHQPWDGVLLSRQSNFELEEGPDVRTFIEELILIATRAVRSDDYDYATSTINRDMKAHFLKNATRLGKIRPPKEAVLFFRAIGGLSQNLENLGARGDFHKAYKDIIDFVVPLPSP
jgi:predicted unusual protein kinase regulating ubiquinone biosynthesis (AarF/ABC1/UbiB family)